MSTMLVELYDALKEAGASEEKARAAAESLVIGSDRLERIEEDTGRLPKMQDQIDRTREDIARLDKELAVVKAQIDFIRAKVPDATIVVHPYSGEAGAIGAALCARDRLAEGLPSRFRGFATIASLEYRSVTAPETVCKWCSCNCQRTFIDVRLPTAGGRPWSKLPLAPGWERVISGNSCPKGLVEDASEMRVVKARLEEVKREHPNVGEMVRQEAFRRPRVPA